MDPFNNYSNLFKTVSYDRSANLAKKKTKKSSKNLHEKVNSGKASDLNMLKSGFKLGKFVAVRLYRCNW